MRASSPFSQQRLNEIQEESAKMVNAKRKLLRLLHFKKYQDKVLDVLERDLEVPEEHFRETQRSRSSARSGNRSVRSGNPTSVRRSVSPCKSKDLARGSQYHRHVKKPEVVKPASLKKEEAPPTFVMGLQVLNEDDDCLTRF